MRRILFQANALEENRIYNYFFTFPEFFSYLDGKRFIGHGISSYSDANLGHTKAPQVSLAYDSKKGLRLRILIGTENLIRETSEGNDTDWVRKEDWFVWTPKPGEEISFQALDQSRLHLHWKSEYDIPFSGILDSKPQSFFARLFSRKY